MDESPLPAGSFSVWLDGMQRVLADEGTADVPCGECTACCTSSQFVHIGPDEIETLARIPSELLFPAPLRPRGHVVLGYDERGHCPMLRDGACSIYEHRPETCRTYDCRVFPATGIDIDDRDQSAIAGQARRWRFDVVTEDDQQRWDALQAAASALPEDGSATRRAVLAVLQVDNDHSE